MNCLQIMINVYVNYIINYNLRLSFIIESKILLLYSGEFIIKTI